MKKILILFLVFITGNVFSENTVIAVVNSAPVSLKSVQNEISAASSDEEIIEKLIKLRGVGKWTAEMILIFTLLRPNVFPIGDIGMIRGIEKTYNSGVKMSNDELYAISEKWKPWRTVACCYMWRTVDPEPVEY